MIRRMRNLLMILVALAMLILVGGIVSAQSGEGEPGVFRNPLLAYAGADPWLVYYEGNYYLATTTGSSELTMRSAPTLAGLKTAIPVQIYRETEPSRCCNMWAPEFHLLDGPNGPRWYFYYSAGTSDTLDNQHTHVLESAGTDPMGPYTYKARIFDPAHDTWAIDGSILKLNGQLYFLFSVWDGPQSLFIAPMSDPWTLSGPRVKIAAPQYRWEGNVNEGPVALYHDDKVFIVFSATTCASPNYALGLLTYTGGDPLNPASWVKSPEPVFQRSDENGVFGPGHNGFFVSPDGTENWIVYHANDAPSDGCDQGRTTRAQKFTWNEDGTPNFGTPVPLTAEIALPSGDTGVDPLLAYGALTESRFRVYHATVKDYIHNIDSFARLGPLGSEATIDSQFYVVPGLADPQAVTIMSVTGLVLRHEGKTVLFGANDGSESFAADATWWIRPGLADETWISFESYNMPGHYLGRQFGTMALVELTADSPRKLLEDATYLEER